METHFIQQEFYIDDYNYLGLSYFYSKQNVVGVGDIQVTIDNNYSFKFNFTNMVIEISVSFMTKDDSN